MNQIASTNTSPWHSKMANGFQFPRIDRPVVALVLGAILFGGGMLLLAGLGIEWNPNQLKQKKPSEVAAMLTTIVGCAYIGAMIFGGIAMVGAAKKPENFWREQFPVGGVHWLAGLHFAALFVVAGMSVGFIADAPNLIARIKAEAFLGRITFLVALFLFSTRASWYALTFSFPRFSPCQYLIFFFGFVALLNDYGIGIEQGAAPSRLSTLLAWTLLLSDRSWRRAESFMGGKIKRLGWIPFLTLLIGNSIVTGYLLWCLAGFVTGRVDLFIFGSPLLAIWFGSIVGLMNLRKS